MTAYRIFLAAWTLTAVHHHPHQGRRMAPARLPEPHHDAQEADHGN